MSASQRRTAAILLLCAVCGAVGLTVLRRVLGYPEVLTASSADTLTAVRAHWLAICVGLVLCGIAAGLLVPITVGLVRLLPGGPGRSVLAALAAAAAGAQLTGLCFWLISVPALARRAAIPAEADRASAVFDAARSLFGVMVGEVLACLLTTSWSVVLLAHAARAVLARRQAPPSAPAILPVPAVVLLAGAGGLAAAGILGGVLLPFGIEAAVTGRVLGQLLWYLWLVGIAVAVWQLDPGRPAPGGSPPSVPAEPARPMEFTRAGRNTPDQGDGRPAPHPAAGQARIGRALPPGSETDSPASQAARHQPDSFFDAATEIAWPATPGRPPRARSLRAAPQPAGCLIGDDEPTDPAIHIPAPPRRRIDEPTPPPATNGPPPDLLRADPPPGGEGTAEDGL
jgi:hypothetical protein